MIRKETIRITLLILLVWTISSCNGQAADDEALTAVAAEPSPVVETPTPAEPTVTPRTEPLFGLADVESLEILTAEPAATTIEVQLRGILSTSCAEIDDIVVQREDNTFNLAVITVQQPGQTCTEAEVPFEEIVTLDLAGLEAGTYFVSVNNLQGSFNLDEDVPGAGEAGVTPTPEATATPSGPVVAAISGRVWHDLCAPAGDEEVEIPPGCLTSVNGGFQANGLLENEPGIVGLRLTLGAGPCPLTGAGVALTEADGTYRFEELAAGTYCVAVDLTDEQNQAILESGTWTAPTGGLPEATVTIAEGQILDPLNFGWDYELLPIPDVDQATCSKSFEFVDDLNIPDDTPFVPGTPFTKRWLLRNNGSCPWITGYSVVFVGGDLMSAKENIPLEKPIASGQTVEVAIDMIAPSEPGSYRGNWQIADAAGEPFGIDGFIEDAFWLRIVVDENAAPLATALPNSGTAGGVVWDDFCINSDPGRGCLEFPEDSGFYIADGSLASGEARLSEITISLAQGACPTNGTFPAGAAVIATTLTDSGGLYRFQNLAEATYCVFMDALAEENVNALIPGNWTWPATGVGYYTIFLAPGEQVLDLDFGWDYVD